MKDESAADRGARLALVACDRSVARGEIVLVNFNAYELNWLKRWSDDYTNNGNFIEFQGVDDETGLGWRVHMRAQD